MYFYDFNDEDKNGEFNNIKRRQLQWMIVECEHVKGVEKE